jgi:hypothetical protein
MRYDGAMLAILAALLLATAEPSARPPAEPASFPAATLRRLPSPRDLRLEEVPRVPLPATIREV